MKRFPVVAFVLLIAGIAFAEEQRSVIPLDNSPSYGPADAPVTIVEFIDFQ